MKKRMSLVIVGVMITLATSAWWFQTGHVMKKAQTKRATGTYTYAIILGAKVNGITPSKSLRYRLDAALFYAQQYPNVILVLSGGQGPDEGISEAQAMFTYLSEKGIPENRMIVEDQSTSTYENLVNAQQLLPPNVKEITLITSDYHIARAGYLAEKIGYRWDAVSAQTPAVIQAKVTFRERLALVKTWIVGH